MKIVVGIMSVIVVFVCAGYFYFESDGGLFDENYSMRIASGMLGNPLYGKSCPRSSYKDFKVNKNKASFIFEFYGPKEAKQECSPVKVIVDRRTGEAWLAVKAIKGDVGK